MAKKKIATILTHVCIYIYTHTHMNIYMCVYIYSVKFVKCANMNWLQLYAYHKLLQKLLEGCFNCTGNIMTAHPLFPLSAHSCKTYYPPGILLI